MPTHAPRAIRPRPAQLLKASTARRTFNNPGASRVSLDRLMWSGRALRGICVRIATNPAFTQKPLETTCPQVFTGLVEKQGILASRTQKGRNAELVVRASFGADVALG